MLDVRCHVHGITFVTERQELRDVALEDDFLFFRTEKLFGCQLKLLGIRNKWYLRNLWNIKETSWFFHPFSIIFHLLFPFIIFHDPEWESFDFSVVVRILEIFPQQASVADFDLGPLGAMGKFGWLDLFFWFSPLFMEAFWGFQMIKDKLSLGHVWIGFIKTRITINDDDDKYTYIYNYNYVIICFFWGAQSIYSWRSLLHLIWMGTLIEIWPSCWSRLIVWYIMISIDWCTCLSRGRLSRLDLLNDFPLSCHWNNRDSFLLPYIRQKLGACSLTNTGVLRNILVPSSVLQSCPCVQVVLDTWFGVFSRLQDCWSKWGDDI